jgi:hypothetical protein
MPDRPRRRIPAATDSAATATEERPRFRRSTPESRETERKKHARTANRSNGGWGALDKLNTGGDFVNPLKITEEPLIIRFLEAEPFDVFRQHWFQEAPRQKAWRCLNEDGESDCPLCDMLGDRPQAPQAHFNIMAFLTDGEDPTHEVLRASKRLADRLKEINADRRFEGLADPRLYLEIHRTGSGTDTTYPLDIVKERDLGEDWGIEPPSTELVAELTRGCYTEPLSPAQSIDQYEALIKELLK